MNHKQFEESFDELFAQDVPPADPAHRSASVAAAKESFCQALGARDRLISETTRPPRKSWAHTLRTFLMNPNQYKQTYGALALGSLAVVATSMWWSNSWQHTDVPISITSEQPMVKNSETALVSKIGQTQGSGSASSMDQDMQTTPTNSSNEVRADSNPVESASSRSSAGTETDLFASAAPSEQTPARPEAPLPQREAPVQESAAKRDLMLEELHSFSLADAQSKAEAEANAKASARTRLSQRAANLKAAAVNPAPVVEPTLPGAESRGETRPDLDEEYAQYTANDLIQVSQQPVSTFSVDVDTASYALVRNQLNQGLLPNPQAVRAEEMINYFDYDYPVPDERSQPFKPSISVLDSPWNVGRKLVHIGIKGYELTAAEQPPSNLVFLLDVSGSMNHANKLPLVKQSLGMLLNRLKPTDTISIVVYAGAAGTVLEPTPVAEKSRILDALNKLQAGGSTAGAQGIRRAYQLAEQNFRRDGVNRIILATDGDFNVGQSSNEDLQTLVERKRDQGIFLTVLGFGRNNYQDDMMQTLAQNGNGVAAYIDTLNEARKVLVEEASANLFAIAKDVKIQVEFNPDTVRDYRLIGYETRALTREDFNNDRVDAGDIGAGHTVTAIYEITPTSSAPNSDPLRYAPNSEAQKVARPAADSEYGFLKLRYKEPTATESKLISTPIKVRTGEASGDVKFSVAVAGFAQLLSNSKHTGSLQYADIIASALAHRGNDEFGYRSEFVQLVRQAEIARP